MRSAEGSNSIIPELSNRYHILRHGHSEGNLQNVIVSDPKRGVSGFGLTDIGRNQVRHTSASHREDLDDVDRVFSSDFLRTRQTAAIVAEDLQVPVELSTLLRERRFGKWEGQHSRYYENVWKLDAQDPGQCADGVESVLAVARRMTSLIRQIEERFTGEHILLVSHGDPLQVLLTAIAGRGLHRHREMPTLETAELRALAKSADDSS